MSDDMTPEKARALLDGATPGRRVQFHGSYCPEAVGTPFTDWDTSHEMSVILPDGGRYRLAQYKHASDAYLSQMAPDLARAYLAADEARRVAEAERDAWMETAAMHLKAEQAFLSWLRAAGEHMRAEGVTVCDDGVDSGEVLSAKVAECAALLKARADAAEAEVARLTSERDALVEALFWCGGSDDFQEGGKARVGWLKLCAPLLKGDAK